MAVNFSKNRYGQSKGFSLVELLVTCTLGGILASLSMLYYDVYQQKRCSMKLKQHS
ncbi:prepilin-type N-terminal cleavage/methylation domain-containing protein [Alteromonas sp. KUL49]|uniref:prepilin-type N-terminal cleavage/methylation domain-containing protein n=1 Tax=Alteromonas sp. KUL49 TaxID=2480798 RepID=UPI00102F0FEE|nr:prepilin-type N-terminal cleavage/methylation domain-containing protein [Alteromonas sp. KUL49]